MSAVAQSLQLEVDHRYHRQELISWWDQTRLASARVLVVGAGALGNEIVKNLALLGVGSMLIVDSDLIENSNLARCVFFRGTDEGLPKAKVAAARAMDLNPDVSAVGVVGDIQAAVGLGAFLDADVVVAGVDNREARLFVNEACWKTSTPWVDGAIEGLTGVMRVFVPPHSACYESTLSESDHELLAQRRACTLLSREELENGKVPTTATCASVIAGMQAQEAVKLLHRDTVDLTFAGKGFYFNGLNHESWVIDYRVREDALSRETYDLERLESVGSHTQFRTLLERHGDITSLRLEREIIREFRCSRCATTEVVRLPVAVVRSDAALCPTCGNERRLELLHQIDATDAQLLELTPSELGLPPSDLVQAIGANGGRFYRFDDDLFVAHV